ncbi:hypothetical protein HGH93_04460 [Chitinophaga polysaccharea]|uniref:hypothetical protein n=1 Tax=Chitinophaga TaxID=79328 RepID=UPI0014555906|nr:MULTISPECIES: hypothetical protein [Chitinophaga]NLR57336.1 hypothetical protein [Chitinophaga polysaccharea]NLU92488.1 hypothetical protein [Chitinophaga sp. Ak27]
MYHLNQRVNVQHVAEPDKTPMAGLRHGINTIFNRGNKVLKFSNHLGNVLATFSDRKRQVSVDGTNPILSTAQEYYPLGSLPVGRGGRATDGGWISGSDNINGFTVTANLTVSSRAGSSSGSAVNRDSRKNIRIIRRVKKKHKHVNDIPKTI